MLLVETVFLACERQFFKHVRYFLLWKQFFSQVGTNFLRSSSFRIVETNFRSSGNVILLFRALLKFFKFRNSNFLKRNLIEETSIETDFLASGSYFFPFSDTPASESYLSSSGKVFLNAFFIPYGGNKFSAFWKPFSPI